MKNLYILEKISRNQIFEISYKMQKTWSWLSHNRSYLFQVFFGFFDSCFVVWRVSKKISITVNFFGWLRFLNPLSINCLPHRTFFTLRADEFSALILLQWRLSVCYVNASTSIPMNWSDIELHLIEDFHLTAFWLWSLLFALISLIGDVCLFLQLLIVNSRFLQSWEGFVFDIGPCCCVHMVSDESFVEEGKVSGCYAFWLELVQLGELQFHLGENF